MNHETVILTRSFPRPVQEVFQLWSHPEMATLWWGPEGFSCPSFRIDAKVGGQYLAAMRDESSQDTIWSTGVIREWQVNRKIVMTDSFASETGEIISAETIGMPGNWPRECLITVIFEAHGKETKIELTHEGIPFEMLNECILGWTSSLNKMERLLQL